MLKGNLSGFSLGEILQSLSINHHTGTLSIAAPDGSRKLIYFDNGEIALFSHGTPVAPRIGEVLVRQGKLTPDQLELALCRQKKSDKMLGKVLLDEELLTLEDLAGALREKVAEEIYDLFLWKEGDFQFEHGSCPEEVFDSLQRSVRITVNPSSVIMEGLRRLDEWSIISSWIRTNHEIYTRNDGEPPEPGSAEEEVAGLLDGETTVEEACAKFSGTRFECCKAIYGLLEDEVVRPLRLDELKTRAEHAVQEKELPKATSFWRYAAEICPEEPDLYVKLGDTCKRLFQEDEANEAFLGAFRLYCDQQEFERASDVAERLPTSLQIDQPDLHLLLKTFVQLRNVKKALSAGKQLSEALQDAGETEKAAEILDSLLNLDPTDLNLRINVATLVQKAGDTEKAIRHYEEVESALEEQKKVREQVKILRLIASLDPQRNDVRQKIATLAILQEKLESRRKRRVTIAGVSVILLVVCTFVPLVYELKARELFTHAECMEQIALHSGQFGKARKAFEELTTKYGWSTKVREAKISLERINTIERHHIDSQEMLRLNAERDRQSGEQRNTEQLASYLQGGNEAEKNGDFKRAHEFLSKANELGGGLTRGRKIRLPVQLTSSPSGARVVSGETELGTTPFVFRYDAGTEISFHVSLRGCEDHAETFTLEKQHGLHFELARKPSWEYVINSNFRQSFHETAGLLIIPSRNGHVYAFDLEQQDIVWSRKVGLFGDRISDLHVRQKKVYLSTVVGEVASIDALNGTPYWTRSVVRGPVLAAPVTSDDSRYVAIASLLGEVVVLSEESGETVGSFKAENEIVAVPIFAGDLLFVGSTDSHVYAFSPTANKLTFVRELSDEIVVDPVRVGDRIAVPTRDGRIHFLDANSGNIVWSTRVTRGDIHSLVPVDETVLVACSKGKIFPVEPATKTIGEPFSLDDRPIGGIVVKTETLYATHADGMLTVWDLETRKQSWAWKAGSPISVPPVVTADQIFVACHSGAVEVLEILD